MVQRKEDDWRKDHNGGGLQQEFGSAINAWVTEVRARGIDPTGDLSDAELRVAEQLRKDMRIPIPVTKLFAFMRAWQEQSILTTSSPVSSYTPTQQEREAAARSSLSKLAGRCDYLLADGAFGTTNKKLIRYYDKAVDKCTLSEIERRIKTVERWIEQGYYDD